jgi:transposase-like protein
MTLLVILVSQPSAYLRAMNRQEVAAGTTGGGPARAGNLLTRSWAPTQLLQPIEREHLVLSAIRDTRFALGVYCPRCQSTKIQRWGSFSGRQRYRCPGCQRTFSDLTLTAAAYTKRLHLWPDYCAYLSRSFTIRRTAALTGINPATAFRWRHAVLRAAAAADRTTTLAGWVEVEETGFAYSEKGRRDLTRSPRARGVWQDLRSRCKNPRVSVPLACDRVGRVVSAVLLKEHPNFADLKTHIMTRIIKPATVVAAYGPMNIYSGSAISAGHRYQQVGRFPRDQRLKQMHHTNNIQSLIHRFRTWLLRFRGVATRYLHHYLAWHRVIDAMEDATTGSAFFRRMDVSPPGEAYLGNC